MGEWKVGQWIVGVTSFQKIFGLCGLKGHIVKIRWGVTLEDARTTECEDKARILKQNSQCTTLDPAPWSLRWNRDFVYSQTRSRSLSGCWCSGCLSATEEHSNTHALYTVRQKSWSSIEKACNKNPVSVLALPTGKILCKPHCFNQTVWLKNHCLQSWYTMETLSELSTECP